MFLLELLRRIFPLSTVASWLGFKIRKLAIAPRALPQLPVEVWEKVIDHIDPHPFLRNRTFAAMSLTCRAFVPRVRYWMYQRVHIHSASHLAGITQVLSYTPSLCKRVKCLHLHGKHGSDASWVILALRRLGLGTRLTSLEEVKLWNVDLSVCHPELFTALSLFCRYYSGHISFLHFRYSRLSQLAHCISAAQDCTVMFFLPRPSSNIDHTDEDSTSYLGPLRFQRVKSPSVSIRALSAEELIILMEKTEFSEPLPSNIVLGVNGSSWESYSRFGTAAVKMIHDFCGDPGRPVSVKLILPYETTIEFIRHEPHRLRALSRILNYVRSDAFNSGAFLAAVFQWR